MAQFKNLPYQTDQAGYLLNLQDWDEQVANVIAEKDNLKLSTDHWQVINYLRSFYQEYQTTPTVRVLVKELTKKLGPEKGNSIFLHKLFPEGLMKQACKIAGLPKPTRCV